MKPTSKGKGKYIPSSVHGNGVCYFVASIDPGITDGCIAIVDIVSGRLVDCLFFSLIEVRDIIDGMFTLDDSDSLHSYSSQASSFSSSSSGSEVLDWKKKKKLQSSKSSSSGKRDPNSYTLSVNRIAECVLYLFNVLYRDRLSYVHCFFVETQIKPHLKAVQACMETLLFGKCILSSPKAVRTYYEISVSSGQSSEFSLKRNEKLQKKAYQKRKELSERVAKRCVDKIDLSLMKKKASEYWNYKPRKLHRGVTTLTQMKNKKNKTYNDAVESYLQAMFPGNIERILERLSFSALPVLFGTDEQIVKKQIRDEEEVIRLARVLHQDSGLLGRKEINKIKKRIASIRSAKERLNLSRSINNLVQHSSCVESKAFGFKGSNSPLPLHDSLVERLSQYKILLKEKARNQRKERKRIKKVSLLSVCNDESTVVSTEQREEVYISSDDAVSEWKRKRRKNNKSAKERSNVKKKSLENFSNREAKRKRAARGNKAKRKEILEHLRREKIVTHKE